MNKSFSLLILLFLSLSFNGCIEYENKDERKEGESGIQEKVSWKIDNSIDYKTINSDLVNGKMTIDVGIYFPSNLDTAFKKVTLDKMVESFKAAKEIYKPTDVQLNLLWVKTGKVNPSFFSIQANETPGIPRTEYANMYQHMQRHPTVLTEHAKAAFEHIVEPDIDNHRTIYLVVLQEVFYPFLDVSEGRNWMIKSVRTGGMSFPTYSYAENLPSRFRGVMTITNLSRPDRFRRTIAHEIGHKAMNVSHEYLEQDPENEVFAEGGLMLYGQGEDIPSGEKGRWHLERLHLSPFIYRMSADGAKQWNSDYKEGGHYYDPIYGNKVIHFSSKPPIDENW